MKGSDEMIINPEMNSVRIVARNPFAWPGGYPVALLVNDGELLCHTCVKENYRQILTSTRDRDNNGWTALSFMILEGMAKDYGFTDCANCGKTILDRI